MTNLTEAQAALLTAAATAREGAIDREGDARTIASLIKKGCLISLPQDDGAGRLLITTAGRAALISAGDTVGRTPTEVGEVSGTHAPADHEASHPRHESVTGSAEAEAEGAGPCDTPTIEPVTVKTLPKGKVGALIQLLQQPTGTTVEAMMAATGWQAHSVRGALSGAIKKNLGLEVISKKTDGGRVYRIQTEAQA